MLEGSLESFEGSSQGFYDSLREICKVSWGERFSTSFDWALEWLYNATNDLCRMCFLNLSRASYRVSTRLVYKVAPQVIQIRVL